MLKLLKNVNSRVTRLLLNVNIGVRLFTLMGLAAIVALLLATAGILGLSASKDSLRAIYEDRMLPLHQLGQIASLMQTQRLLVQASLNDVNIVTGVNQHATLVMNPVGAATTADVIEKNIATIGSLLQGYTASRLTPAERTLADRLVKNRNNFVNQALRPAIVSLRANNYHETKTLAASAQTLYDRAVPDLEALTRMQFDAAHEAYTEGVSRHENIRLLALIALGVAILLMSWLGWMLTASIANPLKQVITIFKKISNNQYDTPIAVEGRDEISQVMRALQEMQTKLGVNEEALHQLAFYDPLTRLPNRRLMRDRLQRALSVSTRNHLYGAVLMIDLDNFKRINDTRGHDVGDRLLVEVALRIQSCVRQADTVARLGGDEFIVMLVDLSPDDDQAALQAEGVGKKILEAIHQPCMLENKLHLPAASMGLCLFLGQNAPLDDLFKRADIAMYQAKSSGRNALRFYDPQIQATLETHMALESELRDALPSHQFQLYYQIQIDNTHGVLGAEVLLRWKHPQRGLVSPDQFIPMAEETGLILPIGEWVLRTACEQLKLWAADPVTEKYLLSVNVSARQFRQPDFVDGVCKVLAQTGINPQRLKLELTESLVLHNMADTIDKMKALNRQGIHFSLDDFGTGYSSLAHLTALPIQQLKIDRSFVRNIVSSQNDAVIVQTIIGMAQNLGLSVIAEGVETEEQRACLERFGCRTYQGYLWGKPIPLRIFEALALQVSAA